MILISRERQRVKVQGPSGVAPSREQREPIFDVLRVGKWDHSRAPELGRNSIPAVQEIIGNDRMFLQYIKI